MQNLPLPRLCHKSADRAEFNMELLRMFENIDSDWTWLLLYSLNGRACSYRVIYKPAGAPSAWRMATTTTRKKTEHARMSDRDIVIATWLILVFPAFCNETYTYSIFKISRNCSSFYFTESTFWKHLLGSLSLSLSLSLCLSLSWHSKQNLLLR